MENKLVNIGDTIEWTFIESRWKKLSGKYFQAEVMGFDENYKSYNVMVDYGYGKQQDKIPYTQAKVIHKTPVDKNIQQSTKHSNTNEKITAFVKDYLDKNGYKPIGDPVFNYPFLATDGSTEINLEPVLEDFADDLLNSDLSDDFDLPELWIKYKWADLESRPKNPGRYLVYRKNNNVQWETWNGSGWAYNNNDILYWRHAPLPPLEFRK